MVAEGRTDGGEHGPGIDSGASSGCEAGPSSEPLCRCRAHRAAEFALGWGRDLVSVRRWPTWVPVNRRPRPRRCPCTRSAFQWVDVLADPGTNCYHGEPRWRTYFRSTLAHNTVEVGGQDQSVSGGPFLWSHQARSRLIEVQCSPEGEVATWSAEHDGYRTLNPPLRHCRSIRLKSRLRQLEIVDRLETMGRHALRLAFHLGPDIDARMVGQNAELTWSDGPFTRSARLFLPVGLSWSLHRGETDPVLGWYSPSFGVKQPAWALVGKGACSGTGPDTHTTLLQFPT